MVSPDVSQHPRPPLTYRLSLVLGLSLLCHYLFWGQGIGINLPVCSLFVIAGMMVLAPDALRSVQVWITAAGVLISGLLVVLNHTTLTIIAHLGALVVCVGFIHEGRLRTVLLAVVATVLGGVRMPLTIREEVAEFRRKSGTLKRIWAYLRLAIIPVVVVSVFFTLFYLANPRFAELMQEAGRIISGLMRGISVVRLLAWVLTVCALFGIMYRPDLSRLLRYDQSFSDRLTRRPPLRERNKERTFSPVALKREYRIAMMTAIMVNLFLFINNAIDLDWLWWDFEPPYGFRMSQFVYEGTFFLVVTILLSFVIILYFYRSTLNFFRRGTALRYLCYVWIAQNALLTLSVALRNYYYIADYGLAYRRIGIFVFLILVLFGLLTLWLKLMERLSISFMFKANSWAAYGILLSMSLVNWDVYIARYNLSHYHETGRLDKAFLLRMADTALPVLWEYRQVFADPAILGQTAELKRLEYRIVGYKARVRAQDWPSWNLADERALASLEMDTGPRRVRMPGDTP